MGLSGNSRQFPRRLWMKKTRVFHWLLAAGFTALMTVATGDASGHQMGGFAGGGFHGSSGGGHGHSFGSRQGFRNNHFVGRGINNHFFPKHRRFFFGFDVVAFGFPYWWYPDYYYGYPYDYADYDASPVYDYRYWPVWPQRCRRNWPNAVISTAQSTERLGPTARTPSEPFKNRTNCLSPG
jgi:hypothetical protein